MTFIWLEKSALPSSDVKSMSESSSAGSVAQAERTRAIRTEEVDKIFMPGCPAAAVPAMHPRHAVLSAKRQVSSVPLAGQSISLRAALEHLRHRGVCDSRYGARSAGASLHRRRARVDLPRPLRPH